MTQPALQRGRPKANSDKPLLPNSSAKSLSLPPFPSPPLLQKTVVSLTLRETAQAVAQYQWRTRTEFPIVRVSQFRVQTCGSESCEVEVEVEKHPARLCSLRDLPLFKVLYLLKESLIGFQRLFQMFGPFVPTSQMVALDCAGRCRVWVSEDFASNRCANFTISQAAFLQSVYRLFQKAANRHKASQIFFSEIGNIGTFCSALIFLDNYAKSNKITIPSCCKINEKDQSESGRARFNGSMTMNNAPKFIAALRSSLRPGSSQQPIILLNKVAIKEKDEEVEESSLSIKVLNSEHTTADLFSNKKQIGLENDDQFLFENLLTTPENALISEPLIRSQHQPIDEGATFRKFSEQFLSIKRLEFMSSSRNRSPSKQTQTRRFAENTFVNCDGTEEKLKFENGMNGIQWEKPLSGLFDTPCELKKSIHQGREQREAQKFELLSNFGKAIKQSYIQEQLESSYQL